MTDPLLPAGALVPVDREPSEFGGRPGPLPYANETDDAIGPIKPHQALSVLHRGWKGETVDVASDAYAPLTVEDLGAVRVQ